eukprot:CAMPEP_0203743956 /NCGR_PEP_ID=MMETSP0098-20131031/191_1 /ASSEMBLY_ACC=CAM_ASM_000208 /TAXON_ID=96639 /ORGANISM=" , Strain NY0313808BC1" /LENGTH=61 /DNA_ID=CAMNT_0050631345 /DNA_START=53 /DNA_END=238 /DNA_ORIENTATION=-
MAWTQNIPAVSIIVLCLTGIGGGQAFVHRAFHNGQRKRIGRDKFDFVLDQRDHKVTGGYFN